MSQPALPQRLSTGVEGLDVVLCGGLPDGGLYLLEGEPGWPGFLETLHGLVGGAGEGPANTASPLTAAEAAVLAVEHALPGGGVLVVARRVPGRDGLRWTVRYDPGTPPAPEAVAALVASGLASITGGQTVASSG